MHGPVVTVHHYIFSSMDTVFFFEQKNYFYANDIKLIDILKFSSGLFFWGGESKSI